MWCMYDVVVEPFGWRKGGASGDPPYGGGSDIRRPGVYGEVEAVVFLCLRLFPIRCGCIFMLSSTIP